MFKICFYTPIEHADKIKSAMFEAGAGNIGNYSHCAWQTLGEGQFLPLAGSQSFIGDIDVIEKAAELKIEMVCANEYIQATIKALKESHPYEEPAYQVIRIEDV
jgi:structural hemagglutinin/hemolysin toxin protein RtxA